MMATELSIRRAIVAALRERGAYVIVTTGVSEAGTPDLLVCHEGRFFAFEVKNERGVVAPLQHHRLDQVRAAGGYAAVVWSVNDVLEAL